MANGKNGAGGGAGGEAPRRRGKEPLGAHSEIGRKLKQYFDGLVAEDVPDRFSQLLSQLEQTEPARGKE